MNNWWIISDTHFTDVKIAEYCGRPLDHEAKMLSALWRIPAESVLVHLGDVGSVDVHKAHEHFIALPYTTVLVRGNHDKKSATWCLSKGWDFVCDAFELDAFGMRILFTHKPRTPLSTVVDLNVHGHFHSTNWRIQDPEFTKLKYTKRYLKFAVEETRYQPVKLKTFLEHHGRI